LFLLIWGEARKFRINLGSHLDTDIFEDLLQFFVGAFSTKKVPEFFTYHYFIGQIEHTLKRPAVIWLWFVWVVWNSKTGEYLGLWVHCSSYGDPF